MTPMAAFGVMNQAEPGIADTRNELGDGYAQMGPTLMIRAGADLVTLQMMGVDDMHATARRMLDIARPRMRAAPWPPEDPTMNAAQQLLAALLGMACLATAAHAQDDPGRHRDRESTQARKHHQAGGSAMQSDAMRNAMGVAMQAIQFAAQNPNASEEDAQATANAIMAGVFSGELGAGPKAPAQRASQSRKPDKTKDYGDYDGN